MNTSEILKRVAHRYPFLLIDRVLELDLENQSAVGLKNVTINEPFFQGHFPEAPVMPGVLVVEAMAQVCGMLSYALLERSAGDGVMFYFAGMDRVRFRRKVEPGDQLISHVQVISRRSGMWKYQAKGFVGEELACEATLLCASKETT